MIKKRSALANSSADRLSPAGEESKATGDFGDEYRRMKHLLKIASWAQTYNMQSWKEQR